MFNSDASVCRACLIRYLTTLTFLFSIILVALCANVGETPA